MYLQSLMAEDNLTVISEITGIPYTTIHDLYSGKSDILKASGKTLYKLSEYFKISVNELLYPYIERQTFESFKSELCQKVKSNPQGTYGKIAKEKIIEKYAKWGWEEEAYYTLGMIDYLHDKYKYEEIECTLRDGKLKETIYPHDIALLLSLGIVNKEEVENNGLSYWKKYNIIENEVDDVA